MKHKNLIISIALILTSIFLIYLSVENIRSSIKLSAKIDLLLTHTEKSVATIQKPTELIELEQQKKIFGHEKLTLSGIMGDECLINDKWYKLNRQENEIKVIEINSSTVKIEYGSKIIVLNLEIKNGKKNERKN
jgi:hypothetical protein